MQKDYTIVVLISGRGSNLKSLISCQKHYKITAVISDKEEAPGLEIARNAGITRFVFPRCSYTTLAEQKAEIYQTIRDLQPSLVVLAGFMQIIAADFTAEYFGKIVNIHPSLLPDLAGLHTHERAIQEKRKVHGCSVHFVDSGVDTGPIIAQAKVEVNVDDTVESLSARVLEREHKIYPWCIEQLALQNIYLEGRSIKKSAAAVLSALGEDFIL